MDPKELAKHKRHIAFDLDDTIIIEEDFPNFGETIEKNAEFIRELHAMGVPIAIYTARIYDDKDMEKKTAAELKERNIPYNELTCEKKPYFVLFVDDRAEKVEPGKSFSDENKNNIMKVVEKYKMNASISKDIEDILNKEWSEEDIAYMMEKIKTGKLNLQVLHLAYPEFVRKVDLLKKLRDGEANVV